MESVDLSDSWQAEGVRLTAFPTPESRQVEPNWWEELVGQPPENISSNPRLSTLSVTGPWTSNNLKPGLLGLFSEPLRIEWRWEVLFPQDADPVSFQLLGDAHAAISAFGDLMARWLPVCPPVNRIAFGAVLLIPVSDKHAAYSKLSSFLPFHVDSENSSDFLYRINRPRQSSVLPITVNRLSTWSAGRVQMATVQMLAGRSSTATTPIFTSCRLELDINTEQGFQEELPHAQLPVIFNELMIIGEEIARNGDRP